jgi:signal transduction histidine kinase
VLLLACIDPARFYQVLLNLCLNTRDAMAGKSVSDSGNMDLAAIHRIFDPFFRTKKVGNCVAAIARTATRQPPSGTASMPI